MKRMTALLALAWHFLAAMVVSGVQTARLILGPTQRIRSGFVDYRFAPLGETGAVLLACLVSLTPGSTAVEVDAQAGRMRLHLLDAEAAPAALQQIRTQFEAPLRRLLGREAGA